MSKKVHLIAIGGSIMHNLALALDSQGFMLSGSDDQIFEPARTRLKNRGICPEKEGWFSEKINTDLSFVVLGMHAKPDNPELVKALELGVKVYSFPELVAEMYSNSTRIVVAGSHGKTTTTSMMMHVFKALGKQFDYLVGAQLEGFDVMVALDKKEYSIIEGDEYLSSCLDPRPKFMHYSPQIAIITGIAWDHYNVFPTFDSYKNAFVQLIQSMKEGSLLLWYEGDSDLAELVGEYAQHLKTIAYKESEFVIQGNKCYLISEEACYSLEVFGRHNLQNMNSVIKVCEYLNFNSIDVCTSLSTFKGAAKRMQLLQNNGDLIIYQDFAHAPSKVKATINALRETYPYHHLHCFLELHTYSSLNKNFLPQYYSTVNECDEITIYFDPKALEIKRMEALDLQFIKDSFGRQNMNVIDNPAELKVQMDIARKGRGLLVFLGSGNWAGMELVVYNK